MIYIGMDVHQQSTTFCLFDPAQEGAGRYRTVTRPTTAEGVGEVVAPLDRQCQVAFEVGTQAQWIARIVRPLAGEVQVANASRIPWLSIPQTRTRTLHTWWTRYVTCASSRMTRAR